MDSRLYSFNKSYLINFDETQLTNFPSPSVICYNYCNRDIKVIHEEPCIDGAKKYFNHNIKKNFSEKHLKYWDFVIQFKLKLMDIFYNNPELYYSNIYNYTYTIINTIPDLYLPSNISNSKKYNKYNDIIRTLPQITNNIIITKNKKIPYYLILDILSYRKISSFDYLYS